MSLKNALIVGGIIVGTLGVIGLAVVAEDIFLGKSGGQTLTLPGGGSYYAVYEKPTEVRIQVIEETPDSDNIRLLLAEAEKAKAQWENVKSVARLAQLFPALGPVIPAGGAALAENFKAEIDKAVAQALAEREPGVTVFVLDTANLSLFKEYGLDCQALEPLIWMEGVSDTTLSPPPSVPYAVVVYNPDLYRKKEILLKEGAQ